MAFYLHHRRSVRLSGYDYSSAGAYFVTVCTQGKEWVLGEVHGGASVPSDAGKMVEQWWQRIPGKFSSVHTDAFVVMPDHIHGIIVLSHESGTNVGADPCVCPPDPCVCPDNTGAHTGAPLQRIVQWFKTMTTNEYIKHVKNGGWKPFAGRLWQRTYYEHVIRDDYELNIIRKYVINNPARWDE
ncbi:MAG TPA: hypothetical protein PKM59_08115 [Thermodesulfobacteriota bacterium]|nr:hypothetical protein [Thermodesulfobacteriota bacterium]HNU72762.1 hypothetical protein [Thermodesulfobacteriota bacterium]